MSEGHIYKNMGKDFTSYFGLGMFIPNLTLMIFAIIIGANMDSVIDKTIVNTCWAIVTCTVLLCMFSIYIFVRGKDFPMTWEKIFLTMALSGLYLFICGLILQNSLTNTSPDADPYAPPVPTVPGVRPRPVQPPRKNTITQDNIDKYQTYSKSIWIIGLVYLSIGITGYLIARKHKNDIAKEERALTANPNLRSLKNTITQHELELKLLKGRLSNAYDIEEEVHLQKEIQAAEYVIENQKIELNNGINKTTTTINFQAEHEKSTRARQLQESNARAATTEAAVREASEKFRTEQQIAENQRKSSELEKQIKEYEKSSQITRSQVNQSSIPSATTAVTSIQPRAQPLFAAAAPTNTAASLLAAPAPLAAAPTVAANAPLAASLLAPAAPLAAPLVNAANTAASTVANTAPAAAIVAPTSTAAAASTVAPAASTVANAAPAPTNAVNNLTSAFTANNHSFKPKYESRIVKRKKRSHRAY